MKHIKKIAFATALLSLVACSDDKFTDIIPMPDPVENEGDENQGSVSSSYDELYRPQIHYTPASNWINDPNGLVYADGVWHMYYQYNPRGNDWGNMSWGHATSTDLVHWTEHPVAMLRNELGDIFSGSAVVDKDNTAGFGAGAIVAIYTSSGDHQQQSIAYSTDGGMTFTQYANNPVIANNVDGSGFRDPKVFWHPETSQWIMTCTHADHDWEYGEFRIQFYGSKDLKSWNYLSDFNIEAARTKQGQWECPDLVRMKYKGADKWVLIVSSNPGGVVGGSATFYFPGDFDGTKFVADNLEYPMWLDTGADNYAGVTWSNAPDGRVIYIGWMNNWVYAGAVPCSPWRSAMTLPRELTLVESANGTPVLSSKIVAELDNIAGEWTNAVDGVCTGGDAYEMVVSLNPSSDTSFTIGNGEGEYVTVTLNTSAEKLILSRTSTSGKTNFNTLFSIPSMLADYDKNAESIELHIYVDHSSVEILSSDGTIAITALVFPSVPYDRITGIDEVTYRALSSIW